MEQEGTTVIILISTIVVLVFAIAMIVLFGIFQNIKNQLLVDNKSLRDIIKEKLPTINL